MLHLGLALLVSALVGLFILRSRRLHRRFSLDARAASLRKVHDRAVPRIGGVAVFAGVGVACGVLALQGSAVGITMLLMLACALPAFFGGLGEDLSGRVSPTWRLLAIAASAGLGYWLTGMSVIRVDLPGLDALLKQQVVQVVFTVVCVAALTNAINIIDGLNGLAGMVSVIILGGLAIVGVKVGDYLLVTGSLIVVGAVLGFLVWNYPRGHLFLGDGGAYLLGFLIAGLTIFAVKNNAQISAWFAVLLLMYPVMELLFSIWRRKVLRRKPAAMPDAAHLHHLVYRRIVRWAVGPQVVKSAAQRNAAASPYLWGLTSMAVVPAVGFYDQTYILMGFSAVFVASYVWVYMRIVRWGVQRWVRVPR